jgi:hypothetical protein
MPSLRQDSAMLSSPRRTSRTTRIFSSAENCRLVARRASRTVSSALSYAITSNCPVGPDGEHIPMAPSSISSTAAVNQMFPALRRAR